MEPTFQLTRAQKRNMRRKNKSASDAQKWKPPVTMEHTFDFNLETIVPRMTIVSNTPPSGVVFDQAVRDKMIPFPFKEEKFIDYNTKLPEAPKTRSTAYDQPKEKVRPKNRRERRREEENRPEVRAYHAECKKVKQRSDDIKRIVVDPAKGLYLSSDPSVKFAECQNCKKRYEILKESPLLDEEAQVSRDDRYGEWWSLNPDTECPDCSQGHRMSGWCMITDTMDSDEEDNAVHEKAMKAGKRDGKTVGKEYNLNGARIFEYHWGGRYGNMCLCTSCVREFELAKYYHGIKQGEKIIKYLRDPGATPQPLHRNGITYNY